MALRPSARPWLGVTVGLVGTLWILVTAASLAEGTDTGFRILRADTRLPNGVYRLDADIDLPLSEPVLEALRSGVALTLVLEMEVLRPRRYWFDEEVASLTQGYRLRYHALSRQFVVTNLNTGAQNNFGTRADALSYIGRLRNFPLIDDQLLAENESYLIRLRARLAVEELPPPLQLQARLSRDWQLTTGWYPWRLTE
jgi:hypothetical protein